LVLPQDAKVNMKKSVFTLFGLLVFLVKPALSQNDSIDSRYVAADTLYENSGLFESDELLSVALRFDITHYKRTRSDKDYLEAILTYYNSDKDSVNKKIKVRSRGEFRRTYCAFPPLLLNFQMKDSIKGEFFKINKLKMVTECKPGYEEILLKEYLVYKLYNVLTENSFRVRLLRVKYINTFKQSKPINEYAFVIEPIDLLSRRLNSVEVKTANLTQKNIKPEMMDRMAIFNYMIGNTDWSVPIHHNILILSQAKSENPDLGNIIPFDFDYSGLVNASYAIPYEGLRIKSVNERLYLGICRSEGVFINALNEFLDRKEEFYKVINEFPYLKEKSKKEMISYLNEFFKGFDERNTLAKKLLSDCLRF
jgi:hypothetical protein